ncbi:MAG: hypothetical protein D6733_00225 [Methanobacteriota archaeon]|nr:MAG: hypothetical protein D6733_00225 [Euryarchaeota archaeon]
MAGSTLFLILLLSFSLGVGVNLLLHRIIKRNLLTLVMSLFAAPLVGEMLQGVVNAALRGWSTNNIGAALGRGIGAGLTLVIGVWAYILASLGTSLYRWSKERHRRNG